MATPRVSENPTTQRHYLAQLTIGAALAQAVRSLWGSLSPLSAPEAMQAFRGGSHALVGQFSQAAVTVAADHYRAARIDAGVTSEVRLPRLPSPPVAKADTKLDWIESQRKRLEAEAAAEVAEMVAEIEAKILAETEAAFQKAIADAAREWTVEAVEGDEKALGFRRVARPDACAWCLALAIRKTSRRGLAKDFKRYGTPGAMGGEEHFGVYKSRESAGQLPPNATREVNRFHFNCNCTVEPVFDTGLHAPTWLLDVDALYAESDGFNDFRRRLNAQRRGATPEDPAPVLPTPSIRPEQTAAIADLLGRIDASMSVA